MRNRITWAWALLGISMVLVGCGRSPNQEFSAVESSLFESVRYDEVSQTLTIRFHEPPGGSEYLPRTYAYLYVPQAEYEQLLAAESREATDRYFRQFIDDQYDAIGVEED